MSSKITNKGKGKRDRDARIAIRDITRNQPSPNSSPKSSIKSPTQQPALKKNKVKSGLSKMDQTLLDFLQSLQPLASVDINKNCNEKIKVFFNGTTDEEIIKQLFLNVNILKNTEISVRNNERLQLQKDDDKHNKLWSNMLRPDDVDSQGSSTAMSSAIKLEENIPDVIYNKWVHFDTSTQFLNTIEKLKKLEEIKIKYQDNLLAWDKQINTIFSNNNLNNKFLDALINAKQKIYDDEQKNNTDFIELLQKIVLTPPQTKKWKKYIERIIENTSKDYYLLDMDFLKLEISQKKIYIKNADDLDDSLVNSNDNFNPSEERNPTYYDPNSDIDLPENLNLVECVILKQDQMQKFWKLYILYIEANIDLLIPYLTNHLLDISDFNKTPVKNVKLSILLNFKFDNITDITDKTRIDSYKTLFHSFANPVYTIYNINFNGFLVSLGNALVEIVNDKDELDDVNNTTTNSLNFFNRILVILEIAMCDTVLYKFFLKEYTYIKDNNVLKHFIYNGKTYSYSENPPKDRYVPEEWLLKDGRRLKEQQDSDSLFTDIGKEYSAVWYNRSSIWGAGFGSPWARDGYFIPNEYKTSNYGELKHFVKGISRPSIIYSQQNKGQLDPTKFDIHKYGINITRRPKPTQYPKQPNTSKVSDISSKKSDYYKTIMNTTYNATFKTNMINNKPIKINALDVSVTQNESTQVTKSKQVTGGKQLTGGKHNKSSKIHISEKIKLYKCDFKNKILKLNDEFKEKTNICKCNIKDKSKLKDKLLLLQNAFNLKKENYKQKIEIKINKLLN